jgi:hypothetical protein
VAHRPYVDFPLSIGPSPTAESVGSVALLPFAAVGDVPHPIAISTTKVPRIEAIGGVRATLPPR